MFDIDGFVRYEFVSSTQSFAGYYVQGLQRLRDAVRRKWQDQWQGQWHRATHRLLCCSSSPVIAQPPQSPDLAPSDCGLFPALRMGLEGARFGNVEDIKPNATNDLRKISKNIPPLLPTLSGSMEQVYSRTRFLP
jgi:hypothetical protein